MEECESGLSEEEQAVMDDLVSAVNRFGALPAGHPSDIQEFVLHVHALQNILASRIVRRLYPRYWR